MLMQPSSAVYGGDGFFCGVAYYRIKEEWECIGGRYVLFF